MYFIPKDFKNESYLERIIYLTKMSELDIVYNSTKSIFPRLKESNKRGKPAVIEILNKINYHTKFYNDEITDIILLLKMDVSVEDIEGYKIFNVNNYQENKYNLETWKGYKKFNSISSIKKYINDKIKNDMVKEIFIDPVEYVDGLINNLNLSDSQKISIIKKILIN